MKNIFKIIPINPEMSFVYRSKEVAGCRKNNLMIL